jgi:uncharacterized protein
MRKTIIPSTLAFMLAARAALPTDVPQPLPLFESWVLANIFEDDDWSGVAGIQGFRGDGLTGGAAGVDPQTVLAADDPGVVDVNANRTDGADDTGGVNELDVANRVVAIQGSDDADAPYLKLYVDTTGQGGVTVRYRLRDMDPSADDAVQPVALQYRVGSSGGFTNVPAAFVPDATQPGAVTLVTPVCAALPADASGAPQVELRILTTNAVGDDENVGVDDVNVSTQACGPALPILTVGSVARAEGNAGTTAFTFAVALGGTAGPAGVRFDAATANGTATTADNDYVPVALTGQTIPPGGSGATVTVTVNGDATAEANESFFLNVSNVTGALVFAGQGTGTIVNDDVLLTAIHDLQGSDSATSAVGPVNVAGIVTGVRTDGFFLQAPEAEYDADARTSEGVFVNFFTAPVPAAAVVGHRVLVTGFPFEVPPSVQQDPLSPTITTLSFASGVTVLSTGNPLPAPVVLAPNMLSPRGGVDVLERFEGMRVRVPSLTVVGPTRGVVDERNASAVSTGEFFGVPPGVARTFREAGIRAPDAPPPATGVTIPPVPRFDGNPERIGVDADALVGAAPIDVAAGAVVTGLVGPLHYGSRTYTVLPDPPSVSPSPVVTGGRQAAPVAEPTSAEVTVASFDLQRFYDDSFDFDDEPVLTPEAYAQRLRKASIAIRAFARTPDVVGLQGLENRETLEELAARVNTDAVAAGQPDPSYLALLFEGNERGGTSVGFLVKQRLLPGVGPRVAVDAVVQEQEEELFVNPDGSFEPLYERPPLRLRARVSHPNGASFALTVIVNDLRSIADVDSRVPGERGWPTVGWRVRAKRRAQAEALAGLVQSLQDADPSDRILVLGGFNAFPFNDGYVDVVGTVRGRPTPAGQAVMTSPDLVEPDLVNVPTKDVAERYTFSSDGDAQALDHALASQALLAGVADIRTELARIGSDFPETDRNGARSAVRLSDHDPVVVFLRVPAFAAARLGPSVR